MRNKVSRNGFIPIQQINIFSTKLNYDHNVELSELCISNKDDKWNDNPNSSKYEDSYLPEHKYVDYFTEEIRKLFYKIDRRLYLDRMWSLILIEGETTMIHNPHDVRDHYNLFLSWVYYPMLPVGMKGGQLNFQTWENGRNKNFAMIPEAGMIIVFPSWINHYTTRNEKGGIRLSISGNMKIKEKDYESVYYDRNSNIHNFLGKR